MLDNTFLLGAAPWQLCWLRQSLIEASIYDGNLITGEQYCCDQNRTVEYVSDYFSYGGCLRVYWRLNQPLTTTKTTNASLEFDIVCVNKADQQIP